MDVDPEPAPGSSLEHARIPVQAYADAWNRHDMAALGDLLADDAEWINIVGMHWRGKAAVVGAHAAYHATFFRSTALDFTEIELRPLARGIAIAVVTIAVGEFTPPDGVPRIGTRDRLSLVLAHQDGAWRIVHGHNTVIDPNAQPFDPINQGWTPNATDQ